MSANNTQNSQRPRVEWKNGKYVSQINANTGTARRATQINAKPSNSVSHIKPHTKPQAKSDIKARNTANGKKYSAQKQTEVDFMDFLIGLMHKRSLVVAFILIFSVSLIIAMIVTALPGNLDDNLPVSNVPNVATDGISTSNRNNGAEILANGVVLKIKEGLPKVILDAVNLEIAEPDELVVPPLQYNESQRFANMGYAVCIDPGHGFDDVGTSNDELGVYEKDVVLNVGLALRDKLEEAGIRVYMTHDTNTPPPESAEPYLFGMKKRNAMANSLSDVDLFLSIHCDAFYEDPTVNGIRIYHMKGESASQGVAEAVSQACIDKGADDNPIIKEMSGMNSYQVLRDSKMPSILVETGFVSNPEEAKAMLTDEWVDQMAQILADSVMEAFENGIIG